MECHHGELADLGFAPSGTIDAVLSVAHDATTTSTSGARCARSTACSRPGRRSIMALAHPFASVGVGADGALRRYGDDERTIGELLTALARANFRIEAFHELGVDAEHPVPTTLVVKTRKQGS